MNLLNKISKWQKRYFRIRLGILQLVHKPLLNLLLIIPLSVLILLIYWKSQVLTADIPEFFYPLIKLIFELLTVIVPLSMIVAIIAFIGILSAISDEANVQIAFSRDELRNGNPILINIQKVKGTEVTQREFYSNVPLRVWNHRIESLADALNVHFVEEIRYGGKANGKRIVLCTAPSRDLPKRDTLYDDEL
jgi:hypothetical protein